MKALIDTDRTRPSGLAVVLLASLIPLTGATWYFTPNLASMPVGRPTPAWQNSTAAGAPANQGHKSQANKSQTLMAQTPPFTPFLEVIPGQDGTDIFIRAEGIGQLGGAVFANVNIGPTHDRGGTIQMPYSNTTQIYIATVSGFFTQQGESGTISLTTTLGLDTGTVGLNRAYVPASTTQTINSTDGNLQLSLVSGDTITYNTYIALVPSFAPPGPPPPGHRLVGSAYGVRAAGALLVTSEPMNLRLYYNETILSGADPHTLAIFAWDAFNRQWNNLGGTLFANQRYLSVATSHFTTYALMATPAWHDDFNNYSGLNFPAEVNNVTLGLQGGDRALVLSNAATSGSAVSQPITPAPALAAWGSLTFTATINPPTTTLTVDILSLDGSPVLTNVASGDSLAGIDPSLYPALKLRANLTSTVAGQTPALAAWHLTWQAVEEKRIYLPVVLK